MDIAPQMVVLGADADLEDVAYALGELYAAKPDGQFRCIAVDGGYEWRLASKRSAVASYARLEPAPNEGAQVAVALERLRDQSSRLAIRLAPGYDDLDEGSRQWIDSALREQGWWMSPRLSVEKMQAYLLPDGRPQLPVPELALLVGDTLAPSTFDSLMSSWSNGGLPEHCRSLVAEGLECHKKGLYAAAICTLLPQVEALATAFLRNQGIVKLANRQGYEARVENAQSGVKVNALEGLLDSVPAATALICFVSQTLYARVAGQKRTALARHGILHGLVHDFASKENSHRTILLVDAMTALVNLP